GTWGSVADLGRGPRLGIGSPLGLMGVVSLPRPFVFRVSLTDPHPFPWIRVLVSAAIGHRLSPDPQWAALRRLWWQLYPPSQAPPAVVAVIERLLPTVPALAAAVAGHPPPAPGGPTLP